MRFWRSSNQARRFAVVRFIGMLAIIAVAALSFSPGRAGTVGPGSITDMQISTAGIVVVLIGGARVGRPACATWDRVIFNLNSLGAQGVVARLLSAQATGKQVSGITSGACSIVPDHETLSEVRDGP